MAPINSVSKHFFNLFLRSSIAYLLKRQKRGVLNIGREFTSFGRIACINALYQNPRRRLIVEEPDLVAKGECDGGWVVQVQDILLHNQIAASRDADSRTRRQAWRIRGVIDVANHIPSDDHLLKQRWRNEIAVPHQNRGRQAKSRGRGYKLDKVVFKNHASGLPQPPVVTGGAGARLVWRIRVIGQSVLERRRVGNGGDRMISVQQVVVCLVYLARRLADFDGVTHGETVRRV